MDNIFSQNSNNDLTRYAQFIDSYLMENQGRFVQYEEICKAFVERKPLSEFVDKADSNLRTKFRDAVSKMQKQKNVIEFKNGKDARGGFRYRLDCNDPFAEDKQEMEKVPIARIKGFLTSIFGFIPNEFWMNVMGNSEQDLKARNNYHLQTDINNNLKNINLLPVLYEAIMSKMVIGFKYNKAYNHIDEFVFHPHFLKEYNNRWFLFGVVDGVHKNCALDRICSGIEIVKDVNFIDSSIDYATFFDDIIGVTHLDNYELEEVIIKVHSEYAFNRILTKELHKSQRIVEKYGESRGCKYGVVSITVKFNYELQGLLLSFGPDIEVLSPRWLRKRIQKNINLSVLKYND